jgi:hypothetical protein
VDLKIAPPSPQVIVSRPMSSASAKSRSIKRLSATSSSASKREGSLERMSEEALLAAPAFLKQSRAGTLCLFFYPYSRS